MKKIKLSLIIGLLALSVCVGYAAETINCSVNNSTISQCSAVKQETDALGHNVKIVREIDLAAVIKSFKKLVSKQLNKKSCEKKVFVKSAKLKLKGESIAVEIRARLNRQYCTRRAKVQVFEKTNSLKYTLLPVVSETGINFVVQSSKDGQATFEKSFTDVVGMDIKQKINQALNDILALSVENISLSSVPSTAIVFRSAVVNSGSNLLTIELSTSIE